MKHEFIIRKRFANRYYYYVDTNNHGALIWATAKDEARRYDNPAAAYDVAVKRQIDGYVISPVAVKRELPKPTERRVEYWSDGAFFMLDNPLPPLAVGEGYPDVSTYRVRIEFLEELPK